MFALPACPELDALAARIGTQAAADAARKWLEKNSPAPAFQFPVTPAAATATTATTATPAPYKTKENPFHGWPPMPWETMPGAEAAKPAAPAEAPKPAACSVHGWPLMPWETAPGAEAK